MTRTCDLAARQKASALCPSGGPPASRRANPAAWEAAIEESRRSWALPVLLSSSVGLIAAVGLLGPSAAVPPLGRSGSADPVLVTALLWLAIATGAAALLTGLRSRNTPDRAPRARRLLLGGLAATALLTSLAVIRGPVGSADAVSYAAYGRAVTEGRDPYLVSPRTVLPEVEAPWRDTPSVYGPLATAEQTLADALAPGRGARGTVGLLAVFGGAAFAGVGLLLDGATRRSPAARARAHLLWTANPLLLLQVVAGVHLDVLLAGATVAAVLAARRTALSGAVLSGAALGAAVTVKATGGLVLAALAFASRGRPRSLAPLLGTAAVVAIPAYLAAGPHVLHQLRRASRYTSAGSPWRPIRAVLHPLLGAGPAQTAVGLGALALAVLLLFRLSRPGVLGTGHPAARAATLAALAYLLSAPYQLAWYDALALGTLALLGPGRIDRLVVGHLALLSAAYVPGRVVGLPAALTTALDVLRAGICPAGLALIVLAAAGVPLSDVGARALSRLGRSAGVSG
ncbi:MAG: hypothetical protein NVSMB29_19390 [Candidatus Dormibacteria bacterium]